MVTSVIRPALGVRTLPSDPVAKSPRPTAVLKWDDTIPEGHLGRLRNGLRGQAGLESPGKRPGT